MSSTAPAFAPSADRRNALDRAHIGDIEGALGTVRAFDTGPRLSTKRKLGTLLAVLGPAGQDPERVRRAARPQNAGRG